MPASPPDQDEAPVTAHCLVQRALQERDFTVSPNQTLGLRRLESGRPTLHLTSSRMQVTLA